MCVLIQVCCVTNPIWVIKTRLQLQRRPGPGLARAAQASGQLRTSALPYTGLVHAVKQIAKEEGLKGFYKGLLPSLFLVCSAIGADSICDVLRPSYTVGAVPRCTA